jgi:hypothetical protein
MRLFPERQWFHLLTEARPKPRLAAGGIPAGIMPLGQLGHEAKAASSGRTQVGGHSRGPPGNEPLGAEQLQCTIEKWSARRYGMHNGVGSSAVLGVLPVSS